MCGPAEESSPWEKASPPLSLLKGFHRPPSTYSPPLYLKRSLGTGDPSDLRPRQMASAPAAPVSTTEVRKCPAEAQLTFKACWLIKLTNTYAYSVYCRIPINSALVTGIPQVPRIPGPLHENHPLLHPQESRPETPQLRPCGVAAGPARNKPSPRASSDLEHAGSSNH